MRPLACILVTAAFLSTALAAATIQEQQTKRIADAAAVLQEIQSVPDKDIPEELWDNARCVAVIPSMKKAAFIIGGEYGKGLISCRKGDNWSAPSFMLVEKGSWGLQIGGESVDLVMLVMNDKGVNRLLEDKVALGGEASVATGPVGRDTRAMTDAQMKAEILSYSRSQGLFAGVDLSGGVLKPDTDDNRDLYGRGVSPRAILVDQTVRAPASAAPFITALKRTMPPLDKSSSR